MTIISANGEQVERCPIQIGAKLDKRVNYAYNHLCCSTEGYYCSFSKRVIENWNNYLHCPSERVILKYLIPKGTTVKIGYTTENPTVCILTLVLINPRVKELSDTEVENQVISEAEEMEMV